MTTRGWWRALNEWVSGQEPPASGPPALLRRHGCAASQPGSRLDAGEHAPFSLCWLNLPGGDSGTARSLPPGDQENGRTSDYCR
jgi:hypothetical protein